MKRLKDCSLGSKNGYTANGTFVKLQNTGSRAIFVYTHKEHASCSRVKLSELDSILSTTKVKKTISQCKKSDGHHFSLLPFYYDNEELLEIYREMASDSNSSAQSEVTKLESIVNSEGSTEGTPYIFPLSAPATYNWYEDDWTRRLAPGIQTLYPDTRVTISATMGLTWCEELVARCLGVRQAVPNLFLFRGSPDIVISKQIAIVVPGRREDSEDSSNDSVNSNDDFFVENTDQRPPLHGATRQECPEKVGEVFANLYILLVSKILRNLVKHKNMRREFEVRGVLVDKVCGAVICILSIQLNNEIPLLNFEVIDTCQGLLNAQRLCSILSTLVENGELL